MFPRSLFIYELLPVFRSVKVAHSLFDAVFYSSIAEKSNELNKIYDEVVIDEGKNFFRRSELVGTVNLNKNSKKYFSGTASVISSKPILDLFDQFWEIRGTKLVCKESTTQELSALARDIHPFFIISLYLYEMERTGRFSRDYLCRIVDNLDYLGMSTAQSFKHAENHMHLGGAYPSENCILDVINCNSPSVNASYPPNTDRDIKLFGTPSNLLSLLGNCARYLIWRDLSKEYRFFQDEDNKHRDIIKHFGKIQNNHLRFFSFSTLKKISFPLEFPLNLAVKNFTEKDNVSFFYLLMFLWSKILKNDSDNVDAPLAVLIIHLINVLRSYSVMAACTGLEFFTKYFSSSLRKLDNKNRGIRGIKSVVNSGVKKIQFRIELSEPKEFIQNCAESIFSIQQKLCRENANSNLQINIVHHYGKSPREKSKSFLEKNKRIKINEFCRKLLKYAGSSSSVINRKTLLIRTGRLDDAFSEKYYGKKIDSMQLLCGIDAAGNEENVPPEVYAPYFRELAEMNLAQQLRSNPLKMLPELSPLRKVFHSGEDFEDIATGLRRINETVRFLSYSRNDRISHALALGMDPFEWYKQKGDIRITKINYLDNMVWLHNEALKIGLPEMMPFVYKCEKEAEKYARELYGNSVFNDSLSVIKDLFDAWSLRRNCPIYWQKVTDKNHAIILSNTGNISKIPDIMDKFDVNGNETVASRLFRIYNSIFDSDDLNDSSSSFYKRANEFLEFRVEHSAYKPRDTMGFITKNDIESILKIQDNNINQYADMGLILEVCPSSNIYIGGFKNIKEHPIFRWNPPVKNWLEHKYNLSGIRKNVIKVCVCTDDPAIFPTTLENEFRLLRMGAKELMEKDDNISEINKWIEELVQYNLTVFDDNYKNSEIS